MILSTEQKLNMQAIDWLEQLGNTVPTQTEIERAEQHIIAMQQKSQRGQARPSCHTLANMYAN